MRRVAVAAISWTTRNWARVKSHTLRLVAFYFGYRILHHEIYEIQHPEPLLIFLGLWLCGIAPATFFDGLRKIGQQATTTLTEHVPHDEKTEKDDERIA